MEVEVAVERDRTVVDRVDDYRSCSALAASAHAPPQRVEE